MREKQRCYLWHRWSIGSSCAKKRADLRRAHHCRIGFQQSWASRSNVQIARGRNLARVRDRDTGRRESDQKCAPSNFFDPQYGAEIGWSGSSPIHCCYAPPLCYLVAIYYLVLIESWLNRQSFVGRSFFTDVEYRESPHQALPLNMPLWAYGILHSTPSKI